MQGTKTILRALAGLSLAGALFMGCQDFLGQKSDNGSVSQDNQTPSELALKLSVKDSGACLDLKNQIDSIRNGGAANADLISKFARQCVEEAKAGKPAHPDLDDQVRCRWIVGQIDGGRDEMVVKFRYYCPDSCETMVMEDSAEHAKVCREPKPEEKPSCDELKKKLAAMDTATEEYQRLRHFVKEICEEPKPAPEEDTCHIIREKLAKLDPLSAEAANWRKILAERKCGEPVPVPEPKPVVTCDDLRKQLAAAANPEDSARIAMQLAKCCPVPVPVPNPIPGPNCDSLRLMLSKTDSGSEAYGKIFHLMLEKKCRMPEPVPTPLPPHLNCDSLRLLLSKAVAGSEAYNNLLHHMAENKCVLPEPKPPVTCDSLRKLLAATTNPEDSSRIATEIGERCPVPLPPPPHLNCDSLRLMLAKTDSGSEAYNRILHQMLETKCRMPVPDSQQIPHPAVNCDSLRHEADLQKGNPDVYAQIKAKILLVCPEPKPVQPNCGELRMHLQSLEPGSPDYLKLQADLAKYCPDAPAVP